jgi:tetratricopeptide (TPR) repeat protein
MRDIESRPGADSDGELNAIIDDARFAALEGPEMHVALTLAARSALALKAPERALRRAKQATELPEQSIDDWNLRFRAATQLHSVRDEVLCVTEIGHRWGRQLFNEPAAAIFQAAREAQDADMGDEELAMLQTLFAVRWQPSDGGEPSSLWHELALLLLDRGRVVEAEDVSAHVSDPYTLVSMRADFRFKPLFHSPLFHASLVQGEGSVRKAINARIDALDTAAREHPRSLFEVYRLARQLVAARREHDALAHTDEALRRIESASESEPPYMDTARQVSWIYDVRANAFEHLGQFDAALDSKQQAVRLADNADTVSHSLNLASLLCRLGRPDAALAALPGTEHASAYGLLVMEAIRLEAADERGDATEVEREIGLIQDHGGLNPRLLEKALIVAGKRDAAVALYVSRLDSAVRRADALAELQRFARAAAPPQVLKWRATFDAVRTDPQLRAAVGKVGRIDSYGLEELMP